MKTLCLKQFFLAAFAIVFLQGICFPVRAQQIHQIQKTQQTQQTKQSCNAGILPHSIRISLEGIFFSTTPVIRYYSMADWNKYECECPVEYISEETVLLTNENEMKSFLEILDKVPGCAEKMDASLVLEHFGIGSEVDILPDSAFCNLYNGHYNTKLKWNPMQQKFLADAMGDKEIRKKYLMKCFNGYNVFRYEVEMFFVGEHTEVRELSGIDFWLSGAVEVLGGRMKPCEKFCGMELMALLTDIFVSENAGQLHNLGWYDHPEHFKGLSEVFEVESKGLLLDNGNVLDGGKYTDNRSYEYFATLKVPDTNPNVRIVYAATEQQDGTLPSNGPLQRKFRKTVKRVLDIPFIFNRVWFNGSQAYIWFFNESNVNDYLVGLLEKPAADWEIDRKILCKSVLVEMHNSGKRNDVYLLLPGKRLLTVIENGYRYNYGSKLLNKNGD
jgi:hypothetical protein